MKGFKRSIPLLVVLIVLLSSCTSLCCNKDSTRIEADIAMATERKEDVEAVQKDAYQRMAWAKSFELDKDFPNLYQKASGDLASADLAYDNLKFPTAKSLYLDVIATLSDDFQTNARLCREEKARADAAMKAALDACADVYEPEKFKAAQDLYSKALALKEAGDLPNALATCRKAAAVFDDAAQIGSQAKAAADHAEAERAAKAEAERKAKEEVAAKQAAEQADAERLVQEQAAAKVQEQRLAADSALACARDGIRWAEQEKLEVDYPEDYVKAKEWLAAAQAYYASGDYVEAADTANEVCSLLGADYRAKVNTERAVKAEADRFAAQKAAEEQAAAQEAARVAAEQVAQEALQDAAEKKAAEERAAAEVAAQAQLATAKLAAEQNAADAALACAKEGLFWAESEQINRDYPEDYVKAKEWLAAAQAYYESGNYSAAASKADQSCKLFDTSYRNNLAAERAAKAEAERLAAQKAAEPIGKLVVTNSPQEFSPDGDGENDFEFFNITMPTNTDVATWQLTLYEDDIVDPRASSYQVKTYAFKTWTGTGMPPSRIVWDGKSDNGEPIESGWSYPYVFKYIDTTGTSESADGTVDVGIIGQKRGESIVFRFPSLVFDPDKATFTQLAPSVIERNSIIISKLIKTLAQYPDYHITIEGHANNVGKMLGYSKAKIESEEKAEVLPLSIARAETIKAVLVANGIPAGSISTKGFGSSQPVYSFTDVQNRWKNRRVEVVLTRK